MASGFGEGMDKGGAWGGGGGGGEERTPKDKEERRRWLPVALAVVDSSAALEEEWQWHEQSGRQGDGGVRAVGSLDADRENLLMWNCNLTLPPLEFNWYHLCAGMRYRAVQSPFQPLDHT